MDHKARALEIFFEINDWLDGLTRRHIEGMHKGELTVQETGYLIGPNNAALWDHDLHTIEQVLELVGD